MPSWAPLTKEQLEQRRIVNVNAETVSNVASTDVPGHYGPAQDDTWNLERFRQNLQIQFHHNKQFDSAFSLVGVDASIANAFRRILLAELPTLAIEDVYMFDNTSIIQDEVLAHRMGLIPLKGGKEGLRWMHWFKKTPPESDHAAYAQFMAEQEEEGADRSASTPSDYNTVVLTLNVECRWKTMEEDGVDGKRLAKEGSTDPTEKYVNSNVYAHQIQFEPQGVRQPELFSGENAIRPVNPDILIAKLRPGQRINMRMHCVKGIGADHAKFSPVATASYRLLPDIKITKPILGADAKAFQKCFPKGVIGVEDDAETGQKKAVVKSAFKDTVSRECLRYDEFKDKVKLGRIRDHFIFSIESSGQFDSDELFIDSIRLLKQKALTFKRHLEAVEEGR
ncbi:DNA-directed RNA polymerases I and III subunit RPAC1 [Cercospora beticola]|uniref:DNA-directed RNA polymerases I and III subunit RPAC1 n=1 Tax=Cercospora beticola TaxID=122368 RepID=A0A2G5HL15_CERBT|nr:DNA-directed RNA polymerases I and III subunit RPAC1 [Cercospora beticola]PIA93229.1 DNA-directed RNA polymerases I and III subunit RPAC1 [Cercospora beticola]WPB01192.1 hypothetical protein RHO25_005815 [Cercospora beticola]CAK1364052.1 unnamed protein product [Cercospora beticola]